ncbi:MAG: sialate O-acetylesterase [Planctomycetota bacterium]
MKRPLSLALLALAALGSSAAAELRLPSVLGDHMVLQRETTTNVWGWAEPGEEVQVAVSWADAAARTKAGEDGTWSIAVATPEAGGPHTIAISAASGSVTLNDVLIGEVWVCSGQSNMEWGLRLSEEPKAAIAAANHPEVRLFDVAHFIATEEQDDCTGAWTACDPNTVPNFSAVGYYFGRNLHQELGVPIGLIGSNWGGTRAEAWTSEATLRADFPEFAEEQDRIVELRTNPGGDRSLRDRQADWWSGMESKEPGFVGRWMEAGFDDSAWATAALPGTWAALELGGFDGCLWYRLEVDVPADLVGKELQLELGPIDDMDLTWLNGQLVGESRADGMWNKPRAYALPAGTVSAGANVITVCAIDTGGVGRVGAEPEGMRLRAKDGSAELPLAGDWRWSRGAPLADLGAWPRGGWMTQHRPSALFNGMLAPILPFAIRGAIWYQGESNRGRAVQYRRLFPAMITDWRERWGIGDFPFYFVQLAPFGYGGDTGQLSELREAQTRTLALPSTGMAVTMDIGNPTDIHPRNKKDVGLRLARWALAHTYGREDLVYSGPLYRTVELADGKARLSFDHAAGLTSGDDAPSHFTVAGEDQVFHPAEARIEGEAVVVWSAAVPAPAAVRYAWGATDEPNLKNGAGLPAPSFRTDDWPPVSSDR